jgi:hypothetical protein
MQLRSNISLRHPSHYKQLKAPGHVPILTKLIPSPTIWHLFSSHTPPPTYLTRRNSSSVFWNPLTYLNPHFTHSNKPKFKQSSTTSPPKFPLATISSQVKYSKNYLLLASNTSLNFLMLLSSSDTSPINGKSLKPSSY